MSFVVLGFSKGTNNFDNETEKRNLYSNNITDEICEDPISRARAEAKRTICKSSGKPDIFSVSVILHQVLQIL